MSVDERAEMARPAGHGCRARFREYPQVDHGQFRRGTGSNLSRYIDASDCRTSEWSRCSWIEGSRRHHGWPAHASRRSPWTLRTALPSIPRWSRSHHRDRADPPRPNGFAAASAVPEEKEVIDLAIANSFRFRWRRDDESLGALMCVIVTALRLIAWPGVACEAASCFSTVMFRVKDQPPRAQVLSPVRRPRCADC